MPRVALRAAGVTGKPCAMTLPPSIARRILAAVMLTLAGCGARASGGAVDEDDGARVPGGEGREVPLEPVARGETSRVGAAPPPELAIGVSGESVVPDRSCDAPIGRGDSDGRACPYLAGGLCYEDQRCACDRYCAAGSACVIHGFLSPGRTQRIDCVEL
jgi:hypothetical protein